MTAYLGSDSSSKEGRMVYMLTFGVLMVNVTIYSIHGSYGEFQSVQKFRLLKKHQVRIQCQS